MPELPARTKPVLRILAAAVLPSLALGYSIFYVVFPSATFPATGNASFPWALLVLVASAVLAGLASSSLPESVGAGMLAIPFGVVVAMLLALSPAFAGLYFVDPSAVPFFVLHFGILVVMMAFPVNLVGTIVGQALRDWLLSPEALGRAVP